MTRRKRLLQLKVRLKVIRTLRSLARMEQQTNRGAGAMGGWPRTRIRRKKRRFRCWPLTWSWGVAFAVTRTTLG
jgi:hypothetical protein